MSSPQKYLGELKIPATTYFHTRETGTIIGAESLTTEFGMGSGVSSLLWSPEKIANRIRKSKRKSHRKRELNVVQAIDRLVPVS